MRKNDNGGILSGLGTDDLILIVVALVLLIDDCDDKLLLIALAFIFLSEWFWYKLLKLENTKEKGGEGKIAL